MRIQISDLNFIIISSGFVIYIRKKEVIDNILVVMIEYIV